MRGPRQRSNILRRREIYHVISMVYRLRGGIVIISPSVSVCSPVCHKVRSVGVAIRASDFRLRMSTVCSGMTLICLQLISPSMHACVHVGECMCVCIHGRMFTYLSSQQHPHNQLILLHFWKQLPFSFLRVDQWRVLFRQAPRISGDCNRRIDGGSPSQDLTTILF